MGDGFDLGRRWREARGFEAVDEALYEAVLGTKLDKRNFRKKVLSFGLLVALNERQLVGRHRPAQWFSFEL